MALVALGKNTMFLPALLAYKSSLPLSQRSHSLSLSLWGAAPGDLLEISTNVRRMFDVAADPIAIGEVLSADSLLRPLLRQSPGLRVPGS